MSKLGSQSIALSCQDRACIESLIIEHSWRLDHGQADRLHELYAEAGRVIGGGPVLEGKEAIQAWGLARKQMRRTSRHVITNIRVERGGYGSVRAWSCLTLYRHDGDDAGPPIPLMVGDYEDKLSNEPDGVWRFLERRIIWLFSSDPTQIPKTP